MPGQLRYNNAPQPYLFDVSAAFRNAADLINTPLRHFGDVADKITTSIQNQNTNELYRYLASQYDPNNVQSINQALAKAAGDNRFSNVGADTWRQATDDYRVSQSELLNKENLALAQRAMDPYQNRINQEAANGSIAGLLAANNAGAQAMLDGKVRSDAIKYGEVDPLRTSASNRALQGARAGAIRAAAARAKQEADNALALNKMKEFYLSNANAGADQRNLNVGQEAIRRFGNSYVNAEFMDGSTLSGESEITKANKQIKHVWVTPSNDDDGHKAKAVPEVVKAIENADLETVISYINKYDTLKECKNAAEQSGEQAVKELNVFPENEYKQALISLVERALNRKN